jgi:hypothetical protein
MHIKKPPFLSLLFLVLCTSLHAQSNSSWSLKLNTGFVSPLRYSQFRQQPYQRTGFQAGLEFGRSIQLAPKLEFDASIGLFYNHLPKSKNYQNDCLRQEFSTFLSYNDSLMGRDLRFAEVRVAPGIRYWLGERFGIGASIWVSYAFYAGIEDYEKVCDRERVSSHIPLEDSPERDVKPLNWGWSPILSLKVLSGEAGRLLLEPGFSWRMSARTEVFVFDDSSKLRTISGFIRIAGFF